jgi:serine/threonine protein kinase
VIVTSSNVAKLIDMGSCMTVEESSASTSSLIVGTPLFLPPERCLRKGEDHRADIYALGLLLYFMTMGTNYIESNDVTDIVLKHAVKLKVPIATRMHGHDPDLSALIQWMTRRDPDERPQTYDELRRAVIQLIVNHMTHPAANSRIANRRKQLRKMYRITV